MQIDRVLAASSIMSISNNAAIADPASSCSACGYSTTVATARAIVAAGVAFPNAPWIAA